jgi:hypothetical protein
MSQAATQAILVGIEHAMVERTNMLKETHWGLIDNAKYPDEKHQDAAEAFVSGFSKAVTELQGLLATLFDADFLDQLDAQVASLTAQGLASDGFPTGAYL